MEPLIPEVSKMSVLPISPDLPSITSLPESAVGRSPCAAPVGPMTNRSGQDRAHASLSPAQARALGLLIPATSGRIGIGYWASAALQLSLASRLPALSTGSILYKLTWKHRVTPLGRRIYALRASRLPTSAKGSTGWPSPMAGTPAQNGNNEAGNNDSSRRTVALAGWVTPASRDWKDTVGMAITGVNPDGSERSRLDQLPRQAALAGWPTPTAGNAEGSQIPKDASVTGRRMDGSKAMVSLNMVARVSEWPTPQAHDVTTRGNTMADHHSFPHDLSNMALWVNRDQPMRLTVLGELLIGSGAGMTDGGPLNPAHSRWLQGYPPEWCDCAVTATQSTSRLRRRS